MIDIEIGRSATGVRKFPVGFRVEFLRSWDAAIERGAKTALLREYALTQNTVKRWLEARERGEFTASMVTAARKSRFEVTNTERAELARLRKENEALKKKVAQGEAVQAILGKAYELLEGITESSTDTDEQIPPALMSATEYAKWLERTKLS
ncbi:hypothetical protein R4172_19345 [Rhodococcus kroppenstedtii]|nr:hypothetical protein [Rhodococcus kroppenstedtii]